MSYASGSSLAFAAGSRRSSIALACMMAAGASLAEPAAGQAVQHPGVYVEEVAFHSGERASGEARLVEPRDFGRTARPTGPIVLEVGPGPLQRALERAHAEGTTLDLAGRMPQPEAEGGKRIPYLKYELTRVSVTSYSTMAGAARVVLGPAGDDTAKGRRTYEPIKFLKRIDRNSAVD